VALEKTRKKQIKELIEIHNNDNKEEPVILINEHRFG